MSRVITFLILAACAVLEAGGDALVRKGMRAGTLAGRVGLYFTAAALLFAYGWLVNRPPWSFGNLPGTYVVLLFVVAQVLAWVVFGEKLTLPVAADPWPCARRNTLHRHEAGPATSRRCWNISRRTAES